VNHLAPILLTELLLAGPAGAKLGRVVNVASQVHSGGAIDPDDVGGARGSGAFSGYGAYAASKLGNVLYTVALARRLKPRGITVNALHPGVVATNLLQQGFGMAGGIATAEGARTGVYLALSPEVEGVTGRYFSHEREAPASRLARDAEFARKVTDASLRAVERAP
jgi:retinol dehydrogenase 12